MVGFFCRNLAVGSCSTFARLGSIAAPYIVMLVRESFQFQFPLDLWQIKTRIENLSLYFSVSVTWTQHHPSYGYLWRFVHNRWPYDTVASRVSPFKHVSDDWGSGDSKRVLRLCVDGEAGSEPVLMFKVGWLNFGLQKALVFLSRFRKPFLKVETSLEYCLIRMLYKTKCLNDQQPAGQTPDSASNHYYGQQFDSGFISRALLSYI